MSWLVFIFLVLVTSFIWNLFLAQQVTSMIDIFCVLVFLSTSKPVATLKSYSRGCSGCCSVFWCGACYIPLSSVYELWSAYKNKTLMFRSVLAISFPPLLCWTLYFHFIVHASRSACHPSPSKHVWFFLSNCTVTVITFAALSFMHCKHILICLRH